MPFSDSKLKLTGSTIDTFLSCDVAVSSGLQAGVPAASHQSQPAFDDNVFGHAQRIRPAAARDKRYAGGVPRRHVAATATGIRRHL